MYKIFEGQAGYYVRDENEDGLHHPPSDYGRRIGWDRPEAERVLAFAERTRESTSRQIAETILSQIKATNFWALGSWGAHNYLVVNNGVQFDVSGSNLQRGGGVRVTLNGDDTYDITAYRVRNYEPKVISQHSDIYCDQLVSILDGIVG